MRSGVTMARVASAMFGAPATMAGTVLVHVGVAAGPVASVDGIVATRVRVAVAVGVASKCRGFTAGDPDLPVL